MQTLLEAQPTPDIHRSLSPLHLLRRHFFRRFFDNDAVSLDAETQTTVVRALAIVAVPTLMAAFWLERPYHWPPGRPMWDAAADHYFFVLYSFIVMGIVATFEWEMLFPDRADFLILLPMPLKSRDLFLSKGLALLSFLGLFLAGANLLAMILFSTISTRPNQSLLHSLWAHFAAVSLAGIFAAFSMLALEGLFLCLFPRRWFKPLSAITQFLSFTLLLFFFLLFPLFGSHMPTLLSGQASFANFVPPLWFEGMYEHLLLGPSAPPGAAPLSTIGLYATAAVILLALLIYPAAWARQKKRALEGTSVVRTRPRSILTPLLHRTLLRHPQSRAIFHFISQTIARNNRYQLYLTIYAGAGFAIALRTIITVHTGSDGVLSPALSNTGLHAMLPLMIFWLITGLKTAFAFPVDMRARWIFPIHLPQPGPYANAVKTWVLLCCAALVCILLCFLLALHWSYWSLCIQAVYGTALSTLLAGLFFLGSSQIPFTSARMPGRTNLPLILVLYAAIFPLLVIFTTRLEISAETHPLVLLQTILWTVALHFLLKFADRLAHQGILGGFSQEEADEGLVTLGLIQ